MEQPYVRHLIVRVQRRATQVDCAAASPNPYIHSNKGVGNYRKKMDENRKNIATINPLRLFIAVFS